MFSLVSSKFLAMRNIVLYSVSARTGPRIFLKGQKDAVFMVIQLCYIVLWMFSHYKWAKIEEVVKMKPV